MVRKLLIDLALGTESGTWPVKVANEPDTPDDVITVTDTQGISQGRRQIDGMVLNNQGFQVRVRSGDRSEGWAKIANIKQTFEDTILQATVSIGANHYAVSSIVNIGEILFLGRDTATGTGRTIHTLNALINVRTA